MSDLDLHDLQRRARLVREFTHEVDGIAFQLCHPTKYEHEHIWHKSRGDIVAGMRALVGASVTGWDGVKVRHVFPESKTPDEPVPYSAEALELVLDEQTLWMERLGTAIAARIRERYAALEDVRKNSLSGSTGNGPAHSETS